MSTSTRLAPSVTSRPATSPVAAWRRDVAIRLQQLTDLDGPREEQLDARRAMESLTRVATEVDNLSRRRHPARTARRAVVVHRSDWVRGRIVVGLAAERVDVVADAADGACGLAHVLVDRPDLVVLEDLLPWVTGVELVRTAHRYLPGALLVVQAEDPDSGKACVEAGAAACFSRGLPLSELCARALQMLAPSRAA